MTRGRQPDRALEKADKIAKSRGLVHYYKRGPGLLADFAITTRQVKSEVKIKRLRRIRTTPAGLEREAADEIAGLRLYPSSGEISRELWIYSPDYFWRFFRVTEAGLVELGRDGSVLQHKAPAETPAAPVFPVIPTSRPAMESAGEDTMAGIVSPCPPLESPLSATPADGADSQTENDPHEVGRGDADPTG